jgi:hypothetical protein
VKINFDAAEKGLQFLEAEPRRFDMSEWILPAEEAELLEEQPPCGTACCFAGAVALAHSEFPEDVDIENIEELACELLEIKQADADRLFHLPMWEQPFLSMYAFAKTQKERVAALRAYIESLKPKAA